MKKLTTILFLMILTAFAAFAQNDKTEQEILKIHSSLDEAFMKKDIAVFERVFADDYIMSSASGKLMNRAELFADLRKEMANTEYKMLSAVTDNLKAKVSGNMAFVTGNWSTSSVAAKNPNAEPHKDTGRYTGIYEKRSGKWMLVAEHWSEAQHDKKVMEAQVMKMGQEYGKMIERGDVAALEQILADEYIYTNEEGKVKNKAEDLAGYKTGKTKITFTETTDQKVRVIGNTAAVETGIFRIKGTTDGKPFEENARYTTTWVWRDLRWQIVADHSSIIKK